MVLSLQAVVATAFSQGLALITPTNTTWRYFTNGTDVGTEWASPGFDDSSWPQGRGLFGNESNYPYPVATPVPGPGFGGPFTAYFRTRFSWNGSGAGIFLTGTNYVDDGCVVYLNGLEITRFNMPSGSPAFDTPALAANPGGYPNLTAGEPVLVEMAIPLDGLTNGNHNPLVHGDNVLAVEVHNNATGSSDVLFGLSLFASSETPCFGVGFINPTNRTIVEGRSTTFFVETTPFCPRTAQWFRNVGGGEELIPGANSNSYTLTNARRGVDEGFYYCLFSDIFTTFESRHAQLTIIPDFEPPRFLSALVVGPGLRTFRLITDEPLCAIAADCGSDYSFEFNWQILQSDDTSIDLGVARITQLTPTTYEFTTSEPRDPTKQYQITVTPVFGEISDLYRHFVRPGTFAETDTARSFQQGDANGYSGTQDTELHSQAQADTILGAAAIVTVDNDDAGVAHGLLRFDNVFGNGPNQIPLGSDIAWATLTLNQTDPGSAANFHRMLVPWDQSTATWNSMIDGVVNDGVEAVAAGDAQSTAEPFPNGPMSIDVTASLRAWSGGQPNYGWAIRSTGTAGWDWNTSESGPSNAPALTVAYKHHCDCGAPVITVQPPASLSVGEFQPFAITVGVSNAFGLLHWTKDGVDIPNATSATFSIVSAKPADTGSYRLRAINPGATVTSDPCVVTIVPDRTRPRVTRALSSANGTNIVVVFNEPISAASAQNLANYSLTPAVDISRAVLGLNNTVTLTTPALTVGTGYSLRIADVTDTAGTPNLMDPNPTAVNLTSARIIAGAGWADQWNYNTNNLDSAPDWKNPGFTPGPDWGIGCGLFGGNAGLGPFIPLVGPICTPLIPNNVSAESELRVTAYFHKTIELPALPVGARYVICHYTDDGFVAYLDGEEIHRFAMPAGAVTFTNRSTGIPTGEATLRSFAFNATPGTHTLAVELHQAGITSSDVLFGMEVRIVDATSPALSIARTVNGGLALNWNADNSWRLRSASTLAGPYFDVAIPVGNPLGALMLPPSSTASANTFFLLDYTGHP